MKCVGCKKDSHKLTRLPDGRWLCPACRCDAKASLPVLKSISMAPPTEATKTHLRLAGLLTIGKVPDYSHN
jgi:hypothetical protein